jgi:3-hydroxybutyryl-CoA dehydrogenase
MTERPFAAVCVAGAGFMGAQIGLQCALSGYATCLADPSAEARQRAQAFQEEELNGRVHAGKMSAAERRAALERLRFAASLEEGVADADLVIEAVPERLDLKKQVFARLDQICPARTILATNSSSLRVSLIEGATRRPDRLLNLHFYGIIWERPMVELMRGSRTSEKTMDTMRRFARSIGMTPLLVQKESTGFLFNRVWRAIKKEALHLVQEGVASHEDVDRAWMVFTGMRLGPFGLMDRVGLDVVRDIENVYYRESGDPGDAPPPLLEEKVAKGELGIKTGKGFYEYPHPAFEDPEWLKGEV